MSKSQHPIALRLERHVGGAVRLLVTVMGLPLVDGIFAAVVLAGLLDTPGGILQVGLLVFGGSATVAVILAEMEAPRDRLPDIALVGAVLIGVAGLEAALAPAIEGLLDLAIFERFAALVILAIAAKTASARIGEYLPRPAVIVGLGMIASFDPTGATFRVTPDLGLVLRAGAAAGVGVAFALAVAAAAPTLRGLVAIDRFRFGSAVALGMLPLALMNVVPQNAPLAVLAVAGVLAFDPDGSPAAREAGVAADGGTVDPAEAAGEAPNEGDDPDPDAEPDPERPPWV